MVLVVISVVIGGVLFQNLTNLDHSRQTRSIQSGEKECTDLSGHGGRGHLVLVCAEHCRTCPLLTVNKLCRQYRWAWLARFF